ncbi:DUF1698 domain-containing protein [Candidatus Erwinia haradaeae]|uniref:DUF1698 domain-containing protein n=1 Tax=Candidatus Erwinia haradaeae TaxID=1922217 RepID=UPI0013007657|nr:DUF1698 domain-containing protein [Candidatus Erwinia haradaeae]
MNGDQIFKWDKFSSHVSSLSGCFVLDTGCVTGYYIWRMLGCDTYLVVRMDLMPIFCIHLKQYKNY